MDYHQLAVQFLAAAADNSNRSDIIQSVEAASRGELLVLSYLNEKAAAVSAGELAAVTKTTTSRISNLLKQLEGKGLVVREVDPSDRRKVVISLTEAGRQTVAGHQNELIALLAKVFSQMGEADAQAFLRTTKLFYKTALEIGDQ